MASVPPSIDNNDISPVSIIDEMKSSYLDYAMSVIVSRALPDVRDGLKPVHRRILFASQEGGFIPGRPYRKSAKIVGEVMGNFHPHGDSAIYMALARLTQDWSMRVPLIDGQGNFGSMDPDAPAAMRYTEARLSPAAMMLLADIDRDTVNFSPNYDGSREEPQVLPARFPNLLVNGAGGIAVGMATNIPPHNLGEVLAACRAYIADPAISVDDLIRFVPGPDFPTGGIILGHSGARSAYQTGRGSVIIRSRYKIEEKRGDRRSIVLTEIPYQVGKSALVEKIAEAAKDKRIEGVSDIRDESNREGVRVVIDLKRDATPDVVLNQLWRHTPAQSSFPANMLALNGGRPETLSLKDIIAAFVQFREEVITRRSKYDLFKARERAHSLLGMVIAVTNLDEVVRIIRAAPTAAEAHSELLARHWPASEITPYIKLVEAVETLEDISEYTLSEAQVDAILALRLSRLTAMGRDQIGEDLKKLAISISELLEVLRNRERLYEIMLEELDEVEAQFATPRRTEIVAASDAIEDEDLIEREEMVVTVTLGGYIKRTPLDTFRTQNRGGKGRSGMATKDEDAVTNIFVTCTHTPVLFFSNHGKVYRLKVWRLPEGAPQARGRPMVNLLPLAEGEVISTVLPLPEDESEWGNLHVLFATAKGSVRRNSMDSFTNVPSNGKFAIRFEEDTPDRLIGVTLLSEYDDVLLATRSGKAIRFAATDVRVFQSRTSTGVRGITLKNDDEVISLSTLRSFEATTEDRDKYLRSAAWKNEPAEPELLEDQMKAFAEAEDFILTVTANGYGKRTSSHEYRRSNRGGQGITNIETSERNGHVVASFPADDSHQLMLVTDQAKVIRTTVTDIRIAGRNTQGVTIFNVADGEKVVSAARINDDNTEENEEESPSVTEEA
ncbi:MAG: DNA gyrase subunit A [Zymomonas mobilis subsp. pomaceae]|uniref:DNA gyrase subunit A n=1 Tax=Zymomonas mobilis subsp. pomaceae (strain ATCC 29192 / DSM 22645 / JCM 10191 / CCUG 17912 / NBRC 13757 / NCIMB 11200 / NRRL B-4491 / Barker I) TaxID=579138 RepID=F8EVW6_ZYMMT|nr:DNA gyrase subunit A [Zymomonas mobilis]AEI37443.1 DNA gyrase, A subunit [Zymomonas mobilis subsp. pomaceae ATCC 29192]MDX5948810.1 DNA gyrase subunit A [Zymomonas mobilis subsp. pomaceae]GEB88618.1 DNA gyrase subunit A [Zymomonas mobilis subsp. pomaceae]